MNTSTHSVIHKRLKCFVDHIAPAPDKREDIKRQSDEIRDCILKHAKADGYKVVSSPNSGSFANKTGLRRSLRGNDEVEGQDIDIAFILKDKDKNGNKLGCLVPIFKKYLDTCWPKSDTGKTKSSATISFESTKLRFDTVPLIETGRKHQQKLIRTNGEIRKSSVEKHNEFTKKRSDSSNAIEGVVKFNECVRLIKWWRYHKQSSSTIFGNEDGDQKVPSFLLIMLCAHAYDELFVQKTHAETLQQWFSYLSHVVRKRKPVVFTDFIKSPQPQESGHWMVCDPMDITNNIVENWSNRKINELAKWFEDARDQINRGLRHDSDGEDQKSLDSLIELFGNSISNQCKTV